MQDFHGDRAVQAHVDSTVDGCHSAVGDAGIEPIAIIKRRAYAGVYVWRCHLTIVTSGSGWGSMQHGVRGLHALPNGKAVAPRCS